MVASLDALFRPNPTASSQFRGVSYERDKKLFRAMFKFGGRLRRLGYFATETDAARRVAEECEYWYGPLWWKRFAPGMDARKRDPWEVIPWAGEVAAKPRPRPAPIIGDDGYLLPARPLPKPPRPRERYGAVPVEGGGPTDDPTGYAVTVWEWGRPAVLGDHLHPSRPALDWPHRRRPWVWATAGAALAGFRQWRGRELAKRWGLFAPLGLWR